MSANLDSQDSIVKRIIVLLIRVSIEDCVFVTRQDTSGVNATMAI